METSFTAIKWEELTKFKNGTGFCNWRLELEEEPDWMEYPGMLSDSFRDYCSLSEILEETVAPALQEPQATFLRESLMKLVCANDSKIVRDFPFGAEDCYYVVLSPDSVRKVCENLDKLDMAAVLARTIGPFVAENDSYSAAEAREYIETFCEIARDAASKGYGLLQHAG